MKRNGKPRVFSYTRFSTPEQSLGDSERRQVESAQRWAAERNLVLDDRLIDKGKSGYSGEHRHGDFGRFLKMVEVGEVPPGSILVVENVDRLSRELPHTQLKTFVFEILERGITVVTLSPPDEFTLKSFNEGGMWRLMAYMTMGHAESAKKAERLKAAWQNKGKLAKKGMLVFTNRCPAWLEPKDGKFVSVAHAAETIRWIFQLKLEGHGRFAIARKLNASASWIPKKNRGQRTEGWRETYVEKILRSRAVLGEFELRCRQEDGKRVADGEPIRNYFPQIVSPEVFNAVQGRLKENARHGKQGDGKRHGGQRGGKTGKANNVLRHLVVCGYCGGPMAFVDKGSPQARFFVCDAHRRGAKKCVGNFARYPEVQQTVLDNCMRLRPEFILPDSGEQAKESKRLRLRVEGLTAEQARIEQEKKNIADSLARISVPEFLSVCEKKFTELQTKHAEVGAELERAEAGLDGLERGRDSFGKWQKNLAGLKTAIAKDADTRLRLNSHLKEFIEKIEVFVRGHEDDVERAEDQISEDRELVFSPAVRSFRKYVSHRLLSPDGRCFRIHFKMSQSQRERMAKTFGKRPYTGLQVAPASSLAYRVELNGTEMTSEGPKVGLLFKEFFDDRKPGLVRKSGVK